jgi:formate/nitrite transporter FocA (FNT family)
MDAYDIDDLINNYSDFEKSIDDKIQSLKKIKDNPDSANTAFMIQLIESQKKSVEQAEKILLFSRITGMFAGGAFIIALGTLSLVYLAIGQERTFWGSISIVAAGVIVMGLLLVVLPKTEKITAKRK